MSVAYRDSPLPPRFGTPTSQTNFCEENFIVTGWIAEFVNTLTNLTYIFYAVLSLRRVQNGNGSETSKMLYYSLATVGVCSGLFHGLLKYYAQLADDSSMLIASACVLHRAMTFDRGEEYTHVFGSALLATITAILIYHGVADEVVLHQLTFLVLILSVAVKTRLLIRQRVTRAEDVDLLRRQTMTGAGCFVFGYFLWQMDFRYCAELTAAKRSIGMPWGFLLEFHGWWHIFTAIGAYKFMAMVEGLTSEPVSFAWLRGSAISPKRE